MRVGLYKINEPKQGAGHTLSALTTKPVSEVREMAAAILLRVLRNVKSYIACVGYSACDNSFAGRGAA